MRKTVDVTITDPGRDNGKVFVITEMPAAQASKLAVRAFMALARAGVEIPEEISQLGVAGIIQIGLKTLSHIQFEEADAILDELLRCVQIRPSPNIVRKLVNNSSEGDDIEEVPTRFVLLKATYALHTEFFFPGAK